MPDTAIFPAGRSVAGTAAIHSQIRSLAKHHWSPMQIAARLNVDGIGTRDGTPWTISHVRHVIEKGRPAQPVNPSTRQPVNELTSQRVNEKGCNPA